jgi:asparagine synthase (glutamine-hydrolysing)
MCGIAGFVGADGLAPDDRARATRMRDAMVHRGPDDAGLWADDHAVLTHRRLSIIDVGGGHQPLANEDGRVWVVFNGEIYNHRDVRRELEAAGHHYRTNTDTETIVHAYEEWGDDCVHRLRGMFGFALWDAPRRRLLLTRDRLGIKPLYWASVGSRLLFASEIKGILASGLITPQPNHAVLSEVLATGASSGADTMFSGIFKLAPGHRLVFEAGRIRIDRYWDLPLDADESLASVGEADLIERFRHELKEAVGSHLMSDVPLGIFLSGGLDSSAIAALAAQQVDHPVDTFSVAFADRRYSELEYAREVATAIGARSHEIVIDDEQFFGALPRLIWHEDEPIAHPSSVPLHFVSALAGQHVKVVLSGEGSDELLAGYGRYPRAMANWRLARAWERVVPAPVRARLAGSLATAGRDGPALQRWLGRYARRSFLCVPRDPAAMFFDNFAGVPMAAQRALLSPALLGSADSYGGDPYGPTLRHFAHGRAAGSLLGGLLYADVKTYLVELLMRQDQMSMSASVESRVPFLDHRFVEFVSRLPERLKLRGFTTKYILREAMKGVLPRSILTRRKMGFPVPFPGWVRGRWHQVAQDVLTDPRSRQRGLFDPAAVDRLLADHQSARIEGGAAIWSLLNVELWHRTFIDGGGAQTLPAPEAARPVSLAA